jgi:hypothetical protein
MTRAFHANPSEVSAARGGHLVHRNSLSAPAANYSSKRKQRIQLLFVVVASPASSNANGARGPVNSREIKQAETIL